jgi:hypothetical protein
MLFRAEPGCSNSAWREALRRAASAGALVSMFKGFLAGSS